MWEACGSAGLYQGRCCVPGPGPLPAGGEAAQPQASALPSTLVSTLPTLAHFNTKDLSVKLTYPPWLC